MWELDTCGKREGDYKDESRNEKKRNHTVQKILTIFDQNGTFLPIVPGKILAKKAA